MERAKCADQQNRCTDHRIDLDEQSEDAPLAVQIPLCTILGQITDNGPADAKIQQSNISHDGLCDPVNTVLRPPQHPEHDRRIDKWDQVSNQQVQIGQQCACLDFILFHAFASSSNALRAPSARAMYAGSIVFKCVWMLSRFSYSFINARVSSSLSFSCCTGRT